MANGGTAVDLRIVCGWCKGVLHNGHPTGPDQISHGICCPCKAKYFPTLTGDAPPECEFEFVDREHQEDEDPVGMNPFTDAISYRRYSVHLDSVKCVHCGLEKVEDPTPCDCEPDDEDGE